MLHLYIYVNSILHIRVKKYINPRIYLVLGIKSWQCELYLIFTIRPLFYNIALVCVFAH